MRRVSRGEWGADWKFLPAGGLFSDLYFSFTVRTSSSINLNIRLHVRPDP